MVLRLKTWESKSPPDLEKSNYDVRIHKTPEQKCSGVLSFLIHTKNTQDSATNPNVGIPSVSERYPVRHLLP
jgi:hypothetical protein